MVVGRLAHLPHSAEIQGSMPGLSVEFACPPLSWVGFIRVRTFLSPEANRMSKHRGCPAFTSSTRLLTNPLITNWGREPWCWLMSLHNRCISLQLIFDVSMVMRRAIHTSSGSPSCLCHQWTRCKWSHFGWLSHTSSEPPVYFFYKRWM